MLQMLAMASPVQEGPAELLRWSVRVCVVSVSNM